MFAGVDRFTFITECQKRNILLVDFSPEELDAELEDWRKLRHLRTEMDIKPGAVNP